MSCRRHGSGQMLDGRCDACDTDDYDRAVQAMRDDLDALDAIAADIADLHARLADAYRRRDGLLLRLTERRPRPTQPELAEVLGVSLKAVEKALRLARYQRDPQSL